MIEPRLEGHVIFKVNNKVIYDSHNDITEEFAVSLLGTVVLGQLQSTGYAQSQYVAPVSYTHLTLPTILRV